MFRFVGFVCAVLVLVLVLVVLPTSSHAQTSFSLFGSAFNFDAVNDCGQDAHGFETELPGLTVSSGISSFPSRYGFGDVFPVTGGVVHRYSATYSASSNSWSATTPAISTATVVPTNGDSCISAGNTKPAMPCDHFGVRYPFTTGPTGPVTYWWLVSDPYTPGKLVRCSKPLAFGQPAVFMPPPPPQLPQAIYHVVQLPYVPPNPPPPPPPQLPNCAAPTDNCGGVCVNLFTDNSNCGACNTSCPFGQLCHNGVCEIQCPAGLANCGNVCRDLQADNSNCGFCNNVCDANSLCKSGVCVYQYGPPRWVKVYKMERVLETNLADLTTGSPQVPQDAATTEIGWQLLQKKPPSGNTNGNSNSNPGDTITSGGSPNSGSKSVVRRWEFYKYSGSLDPVTNQAQCGGDGTCAAPLDGELGLYLGAQMGSVNFGIPSVKVVTTGPGSVVSSTGKIRCGATCSDNFPLGTQVTLTASAQSGAVFVGWGGVCAASLAQSSCVVTVNDADLLATATFANLYTLSIGRSNSGTVVDSTSVINCGSTCSAKFRAGQVVTLTAVPPAGKSFVNWSNGCSGTSATTTVVINSNVACQAVFSK